MAPLCRIMYYKRWVTVCCIKRKRNSDMSCVSQYIATHASKLPNDPNIGVLEEIYSTQTEYHLQDILNTNSMNRTQSTEIEAEIYALRGQGSLQ
eukprot:591125_1